MINYLWAFMIVAAFVIAVFNGKTGELSEAALASVKDAALMCINLIGAYSLWLGILNIARKSGLTEKIANALSGVIRFVFSGLREGSRAISYIALNISANMLGMGNAATPFGLKAMQELQDLNPDKSRASDAMCMLLVVNSTSVQLLPLTVIALRSAAGAKNPADIVITTLLATATATIAGIVSAKILEKRKNRK
jgi:spore maturation protein A